MATKRFDFGTGDYWELHTEMTWGAQRATERVSKTFWKTDNASIDLATGQITGDVAFDPDKWDANAVNETLLLHSTVAWSYGPIAAETMAQIPARHVEQVLAFVNEVYPQQDPLASAPGAKRSENGYSGPSQNPPPASRTKWWTHISSMRRDGRPTSSTPSR